MERRSGRWIRARRELALLGLGLALAGAPALVAGAAGEDAMRSAAQAVPSASKSTWAYDLAGELMSPFCPGRTLASCPSPQAGELIQWIATQEAAGVSRDEVIAILIERHGEEILGAPPAKGITLWAYVFPVLGFVAFGGIAAIVLSRIVSVKGGASAAGSDPSPVPAAAASASVAGPSSSSSTSSPPASAGAPRAGGRTPAADELARIVDAELAERA